MRFGRPVNRRLALYHRAVNEHEPWTLTEGVHDVRRFLTRRAPWGVLLAAALMLILSLWANLGAVADEFSAFMIMIACFSLASGVTVGLVFGRGLNDAVNFAGWIPSVMAGAASVLAVALGAVISVLLVPLDRSFYVALIPVFLSIGACAAVARTTWADV